MVQSNALSRRSDLCPDDETDSMDITLLPDSLFIQTIDTEMHNLIATNLMKDDIVKDAIEALKSNGTPPIKSALSDWKIDDGLLFFKDRCYVPNTPGLWKRIVERYHNSITIGHPGQFKTIEEIRRDYWWPGMTVFIKNFVKGCATCQQMKVNTHPTMPPLSPIKSTTTCPFTLISTDFITDLLDVDEFDSIMVMVDHSLTKGAIFISCNKRIDVLTSADLYLEHVYK